jgi:hypothetical protein
MLRNIPKRFASDAWSLETTTMYEPGEDSIAEGAHEYALAVSSGRVTDAEILFDHRQASERHDLGTKRGLRAAIVEASGDAIEYTDTNAIEGLYRDPGTDENEFRRYFLNQRRKLTARWVSLEAWARRATVREIADGTRVVLGFDGSYRHDSTGLVGATVEETPHLFVLGAWEKPLRARPDWRVPRREVEAEIARAMERFDVAELVGDPPGWQRELEDWASTYGDVVVELDTNQPAKFGPCCDAFEQGVAGDGLTHDGSEVLTRHVGNCVARHRGRHTIVEKSEPGSADKIDVGIAAVLAFARARWHFLNGPVEAWAERW